MTGITPERLGAFFHPQSVAMIGATDNSPWSLSLFHNLKDLGFPGQVFCVNPNHAVVHGEPAFKRLRDIGQPVDLAYVMVSTRQVYAVMEEVAELGISNLVILTSGFAEMGSAGLKLERQIVEFAQGHNMMLLGPNCIGFVNATAHTSPYSLLILPPLIDGPVGIVLQSGALASVILAMAQSRYIGVNLLVSVGNEAMISTTDVIDYLIEDEETRVIALFLESIRHPEAFRRLARKALEHNKPIVALKVGRSEITARTAQAHTGSLVGNDAINDAVFKQLGIIRVNSLEDLLCTAGLLAYTTPLVGRRMAVVTASGGVSSILADRSQEEGIVLPAFATETVERLNEVVPEFTTVQNPMDTTGYLLIDRMLLRNVLRIAASDPGLDFVVCIFDPPRVPQADVEAQLQLFDAFAQIARDAQVPIVYMSYANTTLAVPSLIARDCTLLAGWSMA
jgi:acyl-CoA synthetase (NDP forming)